MLRQICGHLLATGWGVNAKVAAWEYGTLMSLQQAELFNRIAQNQGNQTRVWYDKPYIVCEDGAQGADLCETSGTNIGKPLQAELAVDKSKHVAFKNPLIFRRSDWECIGAEFDSVMARAAEELGARHRGALQTLDTYLLGELYANATPSLPGGYANTINPYGTILTSAAQVLNTQWNQNIEDSMYDIGFTREMKKIVGGKSIKHLRSMISGSGMSYQGFDLYDDSFNNSVISTPANGENAVMFLSNAVRLFFYSENKGQFYAGPIEQLGFTQAGTPDFSAVLDRIDRIQTQGYVGVNTITIQDGYGVIWDVKIKSYFSCEPNTADELVVEVNFICYPVLNFPYGTGTSCELPYSPIWLLNVCLPAAPEDCNVPVPRPTSNSFCFDGPKITDCVGGASGTSVTVTIGGATSISGVINGQFDMNSIYGALAVISTTLAQNPGYGSVALINGYIVYTPGAETAAFEIGDKISVILACGGGYIILARACDGSQVQSDFRGLEERKVSAAVQTKEVPAGSTSISLPKRFEVVSFEDESGNPVNYERNGAQITFEATEVVTTITYK